MEDKALAIRQPIQFTPAEVVENASTQAKLLMNIVEKTGCFQLIAKKKYLQVEAWETIGAFNRLNAQTESMKPIIEDNQTIGYEASVGLYKDGMKVGGATMPCYFEENCCHGKEGAAKFKACMSAAQTFATSKAYRMNYSYVAILAGYEPTPAEEMTGEDTIGTPQKNTEHWCEIHKAPFFKKGRMKAYAHPIEGTDQWCNETGADAPVISRGFPEPSGNPLPTPDQGKPVETPKTAEEALTGDVEAVTDEQIAEIRSIAKERGLDKIQLEACMVKTIGHTITRASSKDEADKVINALTDWKKQ